MTIEERKRCFFGWLYRPGWWTREEIVEKFNASLDATVADAVAAQREQLQAEQKRSADFYQGYQEQVAKLKAERERRAAELAQERAERKIALDNQWDQSQKELAAADQRWQERLKAVEAEHKHRIEAFEEQRAAIRENADTELSTEKANWKAHLERVEAEFMRRLEANRNDWMKTIECEKSASYERAARVAERIEASVRKKNFDIRYIGLMECAAEIRQLAAKPLDAEPKCAQCGRADLGCVPGDCLHSIWAKTTAHDAPPIVKTAVKMDGKVAD